ncbi:DUF3159 domain-containing protein [Acetobacter fallax]|uniref:Intracellular septation protein A n=1 Tax=Acetobacter fallax TaxID=1737473 RepID=A0ABX0K9U2_9PROT|nr:hypothetical protein [Acetobacter fallax]NHO31290.1 hypothetical protein [Acetobacter fallax]NHO34847.1 hypothetical protein [Acetobacter fallax]
MSPASPAQAPITNGRSKILTLLNDFGGLAALWILDSMFGHRVAIELTLLFVAGDFIRHIIQRRPVPVLWWLINGSMAVFIVAELIFGMETLEPFEGSATDAVFALLFLAGAFARPPLIQRFAEQQQGTPFPERRDLTLFFRYLTLFWSGLFWCVALLDAGLSVTHFAGKYSGTLSTIAPILAVGTGVVVSRFYGRALFLHLSKKGVLGHSQ